MGDSPWSSFSLSPPIFLSAFLLASLPSSPPSLHPPPFPSIVCEWAVSSLGCGRDVVEGKGGGIDDATRLDLKTPERKESEEVGGERDKKTAVCIAELPPPPLSSLYSR